VKTRNDDTCFPNFFSTEIRNREKQRVNIVPRVILTFNIIIIIEQRILTKKKKRKKKESN